MLFLILMHKYIAKDFSLVVKVHKEAASLNAQANLHLQPKKKSASCSSSQPASSTTICGDTSRVRSLKEATKSTFYGDTRIHVTEEIKSQLSPRSIVTVGQKRGRVGTTKDVDEGGSKRLKNAGFGIYTSARGTQILNSGTSRQRILQSGTTYKDASSTGVKDEKIKMFLPPINCSIWQTKRRRSSQEE
ncbi:hypothetical protein P3S68_020710 [Capsicum galapagoense]